MSPESPRPGRRGEWRRVAGRAVLTYALAAAVTLATGFILVLAGPTALASNAWFAVTFTAVCALTGTGFCLRRSWRPQVSTAFGAVTIGLAWFVSLVADFATPSSARTTFVLAMMALGFALTYVIIFRPLGAEITQEQTEVALRAVIREELAAYDCGSENRGVSPDVAPT